MEVPSALVVDANVLFSFFQADAGRRRLIHRLDTDGCQLLSPDYVLTELTRDRDRIIRFANISETEFVFLLALLERTVQTVDEDQYRSALVEANELSPHDKDTPYFGLALDANVPIWSDEKAFQEQDTVMVYTTDRLFSLYE